MNRREAIAALTALPAAQIVSVSPLRPKDVIVIMCDGCISEETAERMRQIVRQIWPDNKVLVLGDGLQFKIVEGTA